MVRARKRRRRSIFWRARRVVYVLMMMGLLGLVLVWRAVAAIELPPAKGFDVSTLICDNSVRAGGCTRERSVAQLASNEVRVPLAYSQLPPVFVKALIAGEDREFFEHEGINPLGIGRALYQDIKDRSAKQGGSTITQQFIKQKYLTSDRSVIRKVRETILAMKIEKSFSKQRILEEYCNIIPLGRRAYGVEAASIAYFGHGAATMNLSEATYLVARVRGPNESDTKVLERRRRSVVQAMLETKVISASEARKLRDSPPKIIPEAQYDNLGSIPADLKAAGYDYLMEMVRIEAYKRFGKDAVLGGGLRIYTTVDPNWQKTAYRSIYDVMNDPAADPDGALLSLDESGAIRALVGGRNFDHSPLNLVIPRETGGSGRPPGSIFKSIVLAQYVADGNSLDSTYDAPNRLIVPGANANGSDWTVDNYNNQDWHRLTVREATNHSVNTVYAQLMEKETPAKVVEMAQKLGFSGLDPVASLVLGTEEVQVKDVAAAFLTFANHGVFKKPYLIWRVEDASGKVLYQVNSDPTYVPRQVIEPSVADTVASALNDVVSSGSGGNAALEHTQVAGKTGTTQNNRDAWFAGFTCKFTTVIWLGYPEAAKAITNVHGEATVTGSNWPAKIWRNYMSSVADNDPGCSFPRRDSGKTKETGPNLPRIPAPTTTTFPTTPVTSTSSSTTTPSRRSNLRAVRNATAAPTPVTRRS